MTLHHIILSNHLSPERSKKKSQIQKESEEEEEKGEVFGEKSYLLRRLLRFFFEPVACGD